MQREKLLREERKRLITEGWRHLGVNRWKTCEGDKEVIKKKKEPEEQCVLKTGYFKEDIVTFMECYWKSIYIENSTFKIMFFQYEGL